jgi:L-asparaginase
MRPRQWPIRGNPVRPITFLTTGGTIDKVYFDATSEFEVGESVVEHILREGLVHLPYEVVALMRKDSLELTDEDRDAIRRFIVAHTGTRYIITHGTDTMRQTADALASLGADNTIVLTGALTPARFKSTDAVFNVGMAVAAVQTKDHGVYIAMSGQIFPADAVVKNREKNRFEYVSHNGSETETGETT